MFTKDDYSSIYEDLHSSMSENLFDEFVDSMRSLSNQYISEQSEDLMSKVNNLEHSDKMIAYDLLSGISIGRLSSSKRFKKYDYERVFDLIELRKPSESLASSIRTIPGSFAQKSKKEKVFLDSGEEIIERYRKGEGILKIAKSYGTSSQSVRSFLEGKVELNTSDQELSRRTKDALSKRDDSYYRNLFENNQDWSFSDLEDYVFNLMEGEGLIPSRKAVRAHLEGIVITSSEDRKRRARSKKSRTDRNLFYMVKKRTEEAISLSRFQSIDNLTVSYCNNQAGTYGDVVRKIKEDTGIEISERQAVKVITGNGNYVRRRSRSELIFIETVKRALELKEDEIKRNYRISSEGTMSVDLFIPSMSIAFEFNGDYWHSDEVIRFNYGESAESRHQFKVDRCKERGIDLYYVWEGEFLEDSGKFEKLIRDRDFKRKEFTTLSKVYRGGRVSTPSGRRRVGKAFEEFSDFYRKEGGTYVFGNFSVRDCSLNGSGRNRKFFDREKDQGRELITVYPWHDMEKIKRFVRYRLNRDSEKVFARNCSVKIHKGSPSREVRDFFKNNHILGYSKFKNIESTVILENSGKVVAMGLFSKLEEGKYELKRLAFLNSVSVAGGASKIVKNFIKSIDSFESLITFSDNDLGHGRVYESIGFRKLRESRGDIVWYNRSTGQKFSNKSLYQVGADRLLKNYPGYVHVGVGKGLPSNREIVEFYGFIPIKDTGYVKWEMSPISTI